MNMNFGELLHFHRRFLIDDLLAWWTRHAIDWETGGINTCIADDGTIQSHDRYMWYQLRAVWTFAAAYNRIEKKKEWLDIAENILNFCLEHGRDETGRWVFHTDRSGKVIRGAESIQTEAFALCALAEYARATGDARAIKAAQDTYGLTRDCLDNPGSYGTHPYPIPEGTKAHRVSMQFSLAFYEIGSFLQDKTILNDGLKLTYDVLDNFRRPELEAHLEYLADDNHPLPAPMGTLMGPGHGLETGWFQVEILRCRDDTVRIGKALDIIRWSLEKGWDQEYGGLFLHIDVAGGEPFLPHADKKASWPHAEALCATLMAQEHAGDPWCMEWYRRIHDWAFEHFPDRENGEWTQRLDRFGNKTDEVIAMPVKDPFHVPRAIIYCIEALERITGK